MVDMLVEVVVDPVCSGVICAVWSVFVEVTDDTAPLTDATDAVIALVVMVAAAKLDDNDVENAAVAA